VRWRPLIRYSLIGAAGFAIAATTASLAFNLATDGPPPRPAGLRMADGTRYLTWGTRGSPIVLIPGAFETADVFDALGPILGRDHRVFAIDLSGTGYSVPSPPYDASHLADQVLSFIKTMNLGPAVLVGHSAGAAVAGLAGVRDRRYVKGVVFLDGDALPLGGPSFLGWLLIDPFRTTLLRLGTGSSWLIRRVYASQCGPTCAPLDPAGVRTWQIPLQQPGFAAAFTYSLRHGIPAMTSAELAALRAAPVRKLVVYGRDDPQMSAADAAKAAAAIGAGTPVVVPGRHLTMISSPTAVAAAIERAQQSYPRDL
jgi:pimeloyl-ACP methyl ester carboxylesterase